MALLLMDPQSAGAVMLPKRALPVRPAIVTGVVVDADGPVAGATVRIQLTGRKTTSAEDGTFTLRGLSMLAPVTVTASAPGYYIGAARSVMPSARPVTITLEAHHTTDNPAYEWFEVDGVEGSESCGLCHTSYVEWKEDAHAQSAVNPRFLTLYKGTDVKGNRSPAPEKTTLGIPLPPDLTQPYYGPGFKLDFPNRAGNCATCHTPVAGKMTNAQNCGWSGCHSDTTSDFSAPILQPGVTPVDLSGDAGEGISCEFCHTTGQVYLNKETGLPYEDMPGILSMRLYRPSKEHDDIFFGPLDDVVRVDGAKTRDAYLPLMEESAFCAGCHYGVMGGVVGNMEVTGGVLVYSSFAEWLASPYSQPGSPVGPKSCQDCHMPMADYEYTVFPERGGPRRRPDQIHVHRMPGASDEQFLQNAVTMTTTAQVEGGTLAVEVQIANDKTGHHVPTDSPLRHLILAVEATNADGDRLALRSGPSLPEWAGDLAGEPGRTYAKVLQDEWTGEMPSAAVWRPVRIVEDTRLAAMTTDASRYTFAAPTAGEVTVTARLIYRRAYQQLMEWKGWTDPDIVMEEQTVTVPPHP
jgi:hypothetical protein